jgi:hypothetical protein
LARKPRRSAHGRRGLRNEDAISALEKALKRANQRCRFLKPFEASLAIGLA